MKLRDLVPFRRSHHLEAKRPSSPSGPSTWADVDRLFDEFWRGWGLLPSMVGGLLQSDLMPSGIGMPRVDVSETDDTVELTAELPGIDRSDVDLTLSPSGDALILRGEKKRERRHEGRDMCWTERSYGGFCRTVPLPVEVSEQKAEAQIKDGVLRVTLAKKPEHARSRRRIEVKGD